MNEIELAFNELFFGSGFWLGFIFIISVCLIVSYKIRFSGIIFEIVLLFLALEYLENLNPASNRMWGVILCFVGILLIGINIWGDFSQK